MLRRASPAWPHGPFVEVMRDVFVVTGTFRVDRWGIVAFPRNMTVLRRGDELTIVNSVRLTYEGERHLTAMGAVRHLVRLGAFHGADDRHYLERYWPSFWRPARLPDAPPGHDVTAGMRPDFAANAQVFLFERTRLPEAVLRLSLGGGVLVACDCVGNTISTDGLSRLLRWFAPRDLSSERCRVGSDAWLRRMHVRQGAPLRDDFDRLLALDFEGLIPAHGEAILSGAKDALRRSVDRKWPVIEREQ